MSDYEVRLEKVKFAYGSQPPIVDGLTCHFSTHSLTGLRGVSGRGKSTLLYLIGLLLTPRSGAIFIGGINWSSRPDIERSKLRAECIGFVFQDAALDLSRSVMANAIEGHVYRGASRVDATNRAERRLDELGVDIPLNRRPGQISGGQAARVALCRALLYDPPVVLADEPTGNLDDVSAHRVVAELREAADRGATVIVATHDHRVLRLCDQVVDL